MDRSGTPAPFSAYSTRPTLVSAVRPPFSVRARLRAISTLYDRYTATLAATRTPAARIVIAAKLLIETASEGLDETAHSRVLPAKNRTSLRCLRSVFARVVRGMGRRAGSPRWSTSGLARAQNRPRIVPKFHFHSGHELRPRSTRSRHARLVRVRRARPKRQPRRVDLARYARRRARRACHRAADRAG